MTTYEFGDPTANIVLIQPVDDHELGFMENEIQYIKDHSPVTFKMIATKVDNWNHDLSPWNAPAVFGKEDFGGGSEKTLEEVTRLCTDRGITYILGGYSLAGLFALWAAYRTDIFSGIAAASPSVWFPGFSEYMRDHGIHTDSVYLSLGDTEHKTKNPVMSAVADKMNEAFGLLKDQGIHCTLEKNPGNHFREPEIRTAKAFARILNDMTECKQYLQLK